MIGTGEENPLMPLKLDNPRDTMQSYLDAMRDYRKGIELGDKDLKRRLNDAVRCLDLREIPLVVRLEKGPEAAILLKEVIDRVIVIDLSKIPEDSGDDNTPILRWRLKNTEITIIRVESGEHAGEYLFSEDTVNRVHEFYEKVKHLPYKIPTGGAYFKEPWIEQVIPDWARKTWLFFPNWQWIGLFSSILLGLILKSITEFIIHILKSFTSRTRFQWDIDLVTAIDKPIGLVVASLFWFFAIYILKFDGISLAVLSVIVQLILSR